MEYQDNEVPTDVIGARIGKLAQPWGKTVNALLSLSCKIKLVLTLPLLIWMGKRASARSVAPHEELEAVLICFSKDTTAGMAAAHWGDHLIKVYGYHPPGWILDFFGFVFWHPDRQIDWQYNGSHYPCIF